MTRSRACCATCEPTKVRVAAHVGARTGAGRYAAWRNRASFVRHFTESPRRRWNSCASAAGRSPLTFLGARDLRHRAKRRPVGLACRCPTAGLGIRRRGPIQTTETSYLHKPAWRCWNRDELVLITKRHDPRHRAPPRLAGTTSPSSVLTNRWWIAESRFWLPDLHRLPASAGRNPGQSRVPAVMAAAGVVPESRAARESCGPFWMPYPADELLPGRRPNPTEHAIGIPRPAAQPAPAAREVPAAATQVWTLRVGAGVRAPASASIPSCAQDCATNS